MARVIPNGVDQSVFTPGDQKAARAQLGLPNDTHIILSVGNMLKGNPWKDFPTMQSAVQLMRSRSVSKTIFLVVGQAARDQIQDNVELRFVGTLSDPAHLALYYQAADIYVHTVRADTFPTTILEALSCGCPVIASHVGGIPEQIKHGENGLLIPPEDVSALEDRIEFLLADPELRTQLGRNAAEFAVNNYSFEKMADRYIAYYEQIMQHWCSNVGKRNIRTGKAD